MKKFGVLLFLLLFIYFFQPKGRQNKRALRLEPIYPMTLESSFEEEKQFLRDWKKNPPQSVQDKKRYLKEMQQLIKTTPWPKIAKESRQAFLATKAKWQEKLLRELPPLSIELKKRVLFLIQQLGHFRFERREQAYKKLIDFGIKILPVLYEQRNSKDPEIRHRIHLLLNKHLNYLEWKKNG